MIWRGTTDLFDIISELSKFDISIHKLNIKKANLEDVYGPTNG